MCKWGIELSSFLSEGGWYCESESILITALEMFNDDDMIHDERILMVIFECKWRLLSVYNMYCRFVDAQNMVKKLQIMIEEFNFRDRTEKFNLAQVYTEFAHYHFLQSYYDESFKWTIESLRMLTNHCPILTVIDVLRQSTKTSVIKREFKRAEMLINQMMIICKETFNLSEDGHFNSESILHPKLADVFLDYGFYLLNIDLISISVKLYERALRVRETIFGCNNTNDDCLNLLIALAHEELAYATYVHEYSSGNFERALHYAEKAMGIVTVLLPNDHLLLSSAKRVKALILEEIAIDHHDTKAEEEMLLESQRLHISALNMAKEAFGEFNVQTAKHYGNLGRLYQSMKRYDEAEEMHLKAISIKEQILGPNDYEVALSIGHLASLYNYDMGMFQKAEELYLRSIDIGIKLFGNGYSGLEYDYRGLIRVYGCLRDHSKLSLYANKLHIWKHLRDTITNQVRELPIIKNIKTVQKIPLNDILSSFEKLS